VVPQNAIPLIYDRAGRFLQAAGNAGSGPGEFRRVADVAMMRGDSIAVIDRSNMRITILTGDLLQGRTVAFPLAVRTPVEVGSRLVATGSLRSAASAGWPLHIVSVDSSRGEVVRSFGPDGNTASTPVEVRNLNWTLAASRAGGFWSADQFRYRLLEWSADGQLIRGFERTPNWFVPALTPGIGSRTSPPPSQLVGLQQEADGLLWTYLLVAAPTWREAWPATSAAGGDIAVDAIDMSKLFQTVIEVIDPATARVVSRVTLKEFVASALPGRRAAVYAVDNDGFPTITIRELVLAGR
jgi:hypothetical protein